MIQRDFEIFPKISLKTILPKLDELGIDLLKRLLEYPPEKRITASDALQRKYPTTNRYFMLTFIIDPYFDELRKKEQLSMDNNSNGHINTK